MRSQYGTTEGPLGFPLTDRQAVALDRLLKAHPQDDAHASVQAGLLHGKSICFLPLKVHEPTAKEREGNGWGSVNLVIDEWLLLEYACVYFPCQQNAVVEDVAKGLSEVWIKALNLDPF